MSLRQLPILPTLVVLVAAGIMVALGVWQLGRAEEKAALIARYEANEELPVIEGFAPFSNRNPASPNVVQDFDRSYLESVEFRRVKLNCPTPSNWQAVSGRHANGASGYVHMFECESFNWGLADDQEVDVAVFVVVGWSRLVDPVDWSGGEVTGIFAPLGDDYKVVASWPLAGLEPLAKPDPRDLPNNHLAYAGQWFFFALTALVIYWLAMKKRLSKRRQGED